MNDDEIEDFKRRAQEFETALRDLRDLIARQTDERPRARGSLPEPGLSWFLRACVAILAILVAAAVWGGCQLGVISTRLEAQNRALVEIAQGSNRPPGGFGAALGDSATKVAGSLVRTIVKKSALGAATSFVLDMPGLIDRFGGKFLEGFMSECGNLAARAMFDHGDRTKSTAASMSVSDTLQIGFGLRNANSAYPGGWRVGFEFNGFKVTPHDSDTILQAAAWAQEHDRSLVLMGSTDTTGPELHNQGLAQNRIDAVRAVLRRSRFATIPVFELALGGSHRPVWTPLQRLEPENRCVFLLAL